MKKILNFLAILAFFVAFSACEKATSDIVSPTSTPITGGNVSTGVTGSGGTVTGTGSSGTSTGSGGIVTPAGFSAKFTIAVPDIYNIFENNLVKLIPEGGGISSYFWQFGDGRKSVEKNPIISYSGHGYYYVTLVVTDVNGKTDTQTKEFAVLCNFGGGVNGNGTH